MFYDGKYVALNHTNSNVLKDCILKRLEWYLVQTLFENNVVWQLTMRQECWVTRPSFAMKMSLEQPFVLQFAYEL